MTASVRQRLAHRLIPSYNTTSWLLFAVTVVGGIVVLYLFTDWRHDLMVAKACDSFSFGGNNRSLSEFCMDTRGLEGWVAATAEAVPPTGAIMLMVLWAVYALFGKQLDLVDYSDRRDMLMWISGTVAGLSTLVLCAMGVTMVYFL